MKKATGLPAADDKIVIRVLNACKWKWEVPDDRVTVIVENGWVTLEGELEWVYQSEAAENAIMHLVGVKAVSNHITIKAGVPDSIEIRM